MGYLFENMEKIDIQEERRRTAEARNEAEKAKIEAEEKGIRLFIEGYQELAASKKLILEKLIEKFGLSRQDANAKIMLYWKEQL